jgi:hypothetical protein
MDSHYFRKPDPDPHQSGKIDPYVSSFSQNVEGLEAQNKAIECRGGS